MGVAQQQRVRRGKRITLVRSCRYELTESHEERSVLLHQGEGISVNVSTGGMLILMPHAPDIKQVFEVHAPTPGGHEEQRLALVETRWTKSIPVDSDASMSLVGVKFLLIPTQSGSCYA